MLKNSRTPPASIDRDAAHAIGIKALAFLAGEPELLNRFLSFSGLSVEQLRREARGIAFFTGLLDFIVDHEPTLQSFAAQTDLRPEAVVAARGALAGQPAEPST